VVHALIVRQEMKHRLMCLAILSIGSVGILWSMLDFDLDIRGANLFIRPFHAVGLLATVLITAVVFEAILRIARSVVDNRPALQTLLFVVTMLAVWAFILPLGDWTAKQSERSQKTPYQVGDTGYGWYYWDDSGMGGDPMTIGHILRPAILIPVLPIFWIAFCYLVLRLRNLLTTSTMTTNLGEANKTRHATPTSRPVSDDFS